MEQSEVTNWSEIGRVALDHRRYGDALHAYEQVLRLDQANSLCWDGLGRANLGLRRYRDALEAFERARRLAPEREKDGAFWTGRGMALLELGRPQEALEVIETALAIMPYQRLAWQTKTRALLRLRRFREAWHAFVESVRLYNASSSHQEWI